MKYEAENNPLEELSFRELLHQLWIARPRRIELGRLARAANHGVPTVAPSASPTV